MVPLDTFAGKTAHHRWAARRRPPFFRTKKVALLGNTPSVAYTPWWDASWTLAAHPCCRPRCEREPDWYFDLHPRVCFTQTKHWHPDYFGWLQQLHTPVFMQEYWQDIPASVRYPFELVEAAFASSVTGQLFATNHCAYMFALAMTEEVEEIGLFGCQYSGAERGTQRESLIYWIGRFEQYGGKVVVPRKHNTIMVRKLYGYESHDAHGKLIPEYRPALEVEKPKEGVKTLTPVGQAGAPALAFHPKGEAPALDRCRELYGEVAEVAV